MLYHRLSKGDRAAAPAAQARGICRKCEKLLAMLMEMQQHQHQHQTIVARLELAHCVFVGQDVALRRIPKDLECNPRIAANRVWLR